MSDHRESSSLTRPGLSEWLRLLGEDLYRYDDSGRLLGALRTYYHEPGFRITFLMRTCAFTRANPWTRFGIYHLFQFVYQRIATRYGVYIDFTTQIGGGLYLAHPCSIIVNRRTVIGKCCNLSQNCTIGIANRGKRIGCPTIGDRVFIGPGAVIVGRIQIGDDSAIGANAVVNTDVPQEVTFGGIPAKQVSQNGSEGYVNRCKPRPQ